MDFFLAYLSFVLIKAWLFTLPGSSWLLLTLYSTVVY